MPTATVSFIWLQSFAVVKSVFSHFQCHSNPKNEATEWTSTEDKIIEVRVHVAAAAHSVQQMSVSYLQNNRGLCNSHDIHIAQHWNYLCDFCYLVYVTIWNARNCIYTFCRNYIKYWFIFSHKDSSKTYSPHLCHMNNNVY